MSMGFLTLKTVSPRSFNTAETLRFTTAVAENQWRGAILCKN